jgi:hypothetical protein
MEGAGALSWPSGRLNLTVNIIVCIIVTYDMKKSEKIRHKEFGSLCMKRELPLCYYIAGIISN